jgi:hypothetical protein
MIPLDAIDGTPLGHPLAIIGFIVLVVTCLLTIIVFDFGFDSDSPNTAIFTLIGFFSGVALLFTGGYIGYNTQKDIVASWAEKRYDIQISENEQGNLLNKEIITLNDGTQVQLSLPEKGAEGYLLYKVTERDELSVK